MGWVGHKNMTDHSKPLKKRTRGSILRRTAIHRVHEAAEREREREQGAHRPRSTSALAVRSRLIISSKVSERD